jgi:hypothetical protein
MAIVAALVSARLGSGFSSPSSNLNRKISGHQSHDEAIDSTN